MKNKTKFITELIITVVVASFLTGGLLITISFIGLNLGMSYQTLMAVNAAGGVIFGVIFGYKLNTLIRTHRV